MKLDLAAVAFAGAAATLVAACVMQEQKVKDWPQLQNYVHVVEAGEVWTHCKDAVEPWQIALLYLPVACAKINFDRKECHVIIADNTPQSIVEHELRHCQGWDHDGRLQAGWDKWRMRL